MYGTTVLLWGYSLLCCVYLYPAFIYLLFVNLVYLYSIFAVVLCVCLCCKDINCCAMQYSISCCGDILLIVYSVSYCKDIHSCACISISCCGDVYCCAMEFHPSARIFTTALFCTLYPGLGLFSCVLVYSISGCKDINCCVMHTVYLFQDYLLKCNFV